MGALVDTVMHCHKGSKDLFSQLQGTLWEEIPQLAALLGDHLCWGSCLALSQAPSWSSPHLMTDPHGSCKSLAPLPNLGQPCRVHQLPVWQAEASAETVSQLSFSLCLPLPPSLHCYRHRCQERSPINIQHMHLSLSFLGAPT